MSSSDSKTHLQKSRQLVEVPLYEHRLNTANKWFKQVQNRFRRVRNTVSEMRSAIESIRHRHHRVVKVAEEYVDIHGELWQFMQIREAHASSSSTSTPSQSLGWRNMTGFPWAPIRGSADRVLMFFDFKSATAAVMSSTCRREENSVNHSSAASLSCTLPYCTMNWDNNWVSSLNHFYLSTVTAHFCSSAC